MMTSAAKSSNKQTNGLGGLRAGMTLLEVVIALSLVALIVGIGAIKYADGADERALRDAATKIEAMASRGHAMSILHQKPFWLRFEQGVVVLAGADVKAPPMEGELDSLLEEGSLLDDAESLLEEGQSMEMIYDELPTEALVLVRRWGAPDDAWDEPDEDHDITWQFQSTGLCEPVSIRLESGESWIQMQMHPLTARVETEEMEIR